MKLEDTKKDKIYIALSQMQKGDIIDKIEFIKKHWEEYDYFAERSFDVMFCHARKLLPGIELKIESKQIKRI